MKKLNIIWVEQFRGRDHKRTIYKGNCLKRGAWQKSGKRMFLRGS